MTRCGVATLVLWVLTAAGCSTCPVTDGCGACPRDKKGPKTLFEWAVCKDEEGKDAKDGDAKNGKDEEKGDQQKDTPAKSSDGNSGEGDKKPAEGGVKKESPVNGTKSQNGNGNGNGDGNGDEPDDDEIQTDRPDFTEASTTVGRGRIQLETGYTYVRDRSNGSRHSAHSYPEALLRVGMFAEWFELRLGQNFANEGTRLADGSVEAANGADDLYLGVKFALTEQQKCLPEMALVFQMTVPSGSSDFSAREVLPGVNWLYGWDVVNDCLSVGGSTQANRARGVLSLPAFTGPGGPHELIEGTHSFLEVAQSLTVNYSLTKKLGAYTEWFAIFPHSALDPEVGPEHYLNGGFTYKFTPNTQYDIRAGFGLNRHADDFFAGTGFSFRY